MLQDSEFQIVVNGNPESRKKVESGDFCLRVDLAGQQGVSSGPFLLEADRVRLGAARPQRLRGGLCVQGSQADERWRHRRRTLRDCRFWGSRARRGDRLGTSKVGFLAGIGAVGINSLPNPRLERPCRHRSHRASR